MADNTTLNTGSGGDTMRTEDRITYKTPVSLIDVGGTSGESILGDTGITLPVGGLVAHDATISGKPIILGVYAKATAPTAVSADGDAVYLWADLNGRLQVGDGGSTLSVDDGAGSLTVDNAGTFAVQATCTNAGTFAVQAACTNAGTFVVQENGAALTALQLIDDAVYTDGAGTPSKGLAVMGTDGTNPQIISTNSSGHVNIADGSNSITVDNGGTFAVQATCTNAGTFAVQESGGALTSLQLIDDGIATVGSAITTKGMAAVGTDGTNARIIKTNTSGELQVDVLTVPTITVNSHAVTNAGTFAVQVDGSALTALQKIDDPVLVDDAAFTPATSSVSMAGFQADETATDSVDEGDAGAARMTLDRKIIFTQQPHTAGGLSMSTIIGTTTTNATVVKNGAGKLYKVTVSSKSSSIVYMKFYNKATTPDQNDTPVLQVMVPSNTSGVSGELFSSALGDEFSAGISYRVTGAVGTTDATVITANDHYFNVSYK